MNRVKMITLLMIIGALLSACGTTEDNTVSGNSMTVAEEIALGVSEDIIPVEATVAIELQLQIPDKFRASKSNTENNKTFVSENVDDNSYICYIRQEKDERADYSKLTEENYREALEQQLETEVNISSIEQSELNGYEETILNLTYSRNNVNYEVRECIFITERYLFTVVYAMDTKVNWRKQFDQSMDSIALESTLSLMKNGEE